MSASGGLGMTSGVIPLSQVTNMPGFGTIPPRLDFRVAQAVMPTERQRELLWSDPVVWIPDHGPERVVDWICGPDYKPTLAEITRGLDSKDAEVRAWVASQWVSKLPDPGEVV